MSKPTSIDDLSVAEIKEVLKAGGNDLEDEQVAAIRRFISRVGGIKNARHAMAVLTELEDAA